jgi:hypothetical protein
MIIILKKKKLNLIHNEINRVKDSSTLSIFENFNEYLIINE